MYNFDEIMFRYSREIGFLAKNILCIVGEDRYR